MQNAELDEAQAGIKKERLDEGEKGQWKSWLITQHSEKWRSCHPVSSFYANKWEKVETVTAFIFFV